MVNGDFPLSGLASASLVVAVAVAAAAAVVPDFDCDVGGGGVLDVVSSSFDGWVFSSTTGGADSKVFDQHFSFVI